MKKILVLIVASTIFISCWVKEAPEWDRTYQVKNESGYDITIRAFEMYTGEGSFEDINLINQDIYIGSEIDIQSFSDPYSNPNNSTPTASFGFNRFVIIFNNERSKIHSIDLDDNGNTVFSEPANRNLLRGGSYTDIGNDFFEFVLTEEDYNNAEPCDGDCLD